MEAHIINMGDTTKSGLADLKAGGFNDEVKDVSDVPACDIQKNKSRGTKQEELIPL